MFYSTHNYHRFLAGSAALLLTLAAGQAFATDKKQKINHQSRDYLAQFLEETDPAEAKPLQKTDLREGQDAFNIIYSADMDEAKPANVDAKRLSRRYISTGNRFEIKKYNEIKPRKPRQKIDAELLKRLDDKGPNHYEQVMLSFTSPVRIPRFPEPAAKESRESRANKIALRRTQALINGVKKQRAKYYKQRETKLAKYEIKVLDTFWLIDAMLVEMPLGAAKELAQWNDTLFISLNESEALPPAPDGNSNNDVQDGRRIIRSDPYFNIGLNGGYIGLLDTGVRDTHEVFSSPDNLAFLRDCVDGGSSCTGAGNTTTDIWPHGTSSAAIISAGNGVSPDHRGVTDITLDSFRVYRARNTSSGANLRSASIRGFQRALAVLDRVIVGELQLGGDHWSDVSLAADAAFDAGAVVVSANGNRSNGPTNVASPANAHRGIGTGRTNLGSNTPSTDQIDGPTDDGRIKPDVQAPSVTETARGDGNSNYSTFSGTSGSTPYAAGAAALLRNWLRGTSFSIDPGQVYAHLILSGQLTGPMNNRNGAGMINLPVNGRASWGKTQVSKGDVISIPFNVNGDDNVVVDASLWWPEGHEGPVLAGNPLIANMFDNFHSDIDLRIKDPNGVTRASSVNVNSVFERARATGTIQPGTWTIEIRGYDTWADDRPVYWAARTSRTP